MGRGCCSVDRGPLHAVAPDVGADAMHHAIFKLAFISAVQQSRVINKSGRRRTRGCAMPHLSLLGKVSTPCECNSLPFLVRPSYLHSKHLRCL